MDLMAAQGLGVFGRETEMRADILISAYPASGVTKSCIRAEIFTA
jgi:hypothetical protein